MIKKDDEYTTKEIAEKYGLTHANVRVRITRLGIKPIKKLGNYPIYSKEQAEAISKNEKLSSC
jgi:hypothetical protein